MRMDGEIMRKESEHWSLEFDDGVIVGRFQEDMPLDAFEAEVYPAFEAIVEEHDTDIVGTADRVDTEGILHDEVLSVWERAAREASTLPHFERGAIVAEGMTKYALKNALNAPTVVIKAFDDLDTAIEWARDGD